MKKLKLKVQELGATELLTREQMKKVLGGTAQGSGCSITNGACGGICIEPDMSCGYEPGFGGCMCDYY